MNSNPINRWARSKGYSPTFTWLLLINAAVFALYSLSVISGYIVSVGLAEGFTRLLALPAERAQIVTRPWTLVTYMFFHQEAFHFAVNMLWFWVFGRIFLQYLSWKDLIRVYLYAGIGGGFLYALLFNLIPAFQPHVPISYALGASGAIMGVTLAATMCAPNSQVSLFGLFNLKLKHLAIIIVAIDFLSIAGPNAGGHIAHLGGAIVGLLYRPFMTWLQGFNRPAGARKTRYRKASSPFTSPKKGRKKGDKVKSEAQDDPKREEERVDAILRKLSKGGYAALTDEEKATLFRQQKR